MKGENKDSIFVLVIIQTESPMSVKTINKTPNGQITYITDRDTYFVEFGNQCFYLKEENLNHFRKYVETIDFQHYLQKNKDAVNNRKLMLNIGLQNVFFCVNKNEFLELKQLLSKRKNLEICDDLLNLNIIYN